MLDFDPIAEASRQWERHFDDAPLPAMAAVTSVMRAQQLLLARLNAELEPHGLTFPRYEALMVLFFSRAGSLPLSKLGTRLQVHPTSVTPIVDGLVRGGLATREPHPSDRRMILATITERGRAVAAAATASLHAIRFGTEPLDDQELDRIGMTLERFRRGAGDFHISGDR